MKVHLRFIEHEVIESKIARPQAEDDYWIYSYHANFKLEKPAGYIKELFLDGVQVKISDLGPADISTDGNVITVKDFDLTPHGNRIPEFSAVMSDIKVDE